MFFIAVRRRLVWVGLKTLQRLQTKRVEHFSYQVDSILANANVNQTGASSVDTAASTGANKYLSWLCLVTLTVINN